MSTGLPPGGTTPGRVAHASGVVPTAHPTGTSRSSALPTRSTAAAPLGFSSVSTRLADGLQLEEHRSPPPGQLAVVMAALTIGLLLMGTQLWLLTVALELYLGGQGRQVWLLALVSGAIFAGGVVMLRLLDRRPRVDR